MADTLDNLFWKFCVRYYINAWEYKNCVWHVKLLFWIDNSESNFGPGTFINTFIKYACCRCKSPPSSS